MKIIKTKKTIENYIEELLNRSKERQEKGILIPFSYKEDAINFLKLGTFLQYKLLDHFQVTRGSNNSIWIRVSFGFSKKIILCSTSQSPTD